MATESRLIRNAIFIFIIPILIENQSTNNRASSRWQITHFLNLLPYLSIYKIHQISEKFGLVTFEKYSCQLGGGTKIHVKDGIPFHERPDLNTACFESCIIEVPRTKCKKLFIWIVYRAPDIHLDTFIDGLNSSLPNIPDSAQLVLLGDFNVSYSGIKRQRKTQISESGCFA